MNGRLSSSCPVLLEAQTVDTDNPILRLLMDYGFCQELFEKCVWSLYMKQVVKFLSVIFASSAIYLLVLIGWLQFSAAYFSASTPSWKHYLLGSFLVFEPIIIHLSIKKIMRSGEINYAWAFSPIIWMLLVIVIVWLQGMIV